ncbi:hypothetical protein [Streptomyces bobili]|uniref:hypothetical protein n=1 Tax=Streptomyces bobili TaxID=67280 RepID=UPI0038120AE2
MGTSVEDEGGGGVDDVRQLPDRLGHEHAGLASGAFVPTCNLQYGNTGEGVALQRVLNKMTWPACIGCHCY